MPGANKYSVATTNRFALDSAGESSGSEDEGINQDPFAMIKQAEIDAVKNAKNAVKAKALADKEAKMAAAKAAKAAITGDKKVEGEKKTDRRNDRPRREPRGNQQARTGKRFEKNDENKDGENADNKLSERDGNRPARTNDRRRGNDRKSGDPRTGYRSGAQGEKRQGGGKFNTGKATENQDDAEKATPEATTDDNVENKDPEVVAEEEAEPVEPEEVQLSLEEYMAQLAGPSEAAAKAARKANDGENVLKGNVIQSTKIHQEKARKFGGIEKVENKIVIDSKDLGFKSGSNQRGGERNYYADGENNNRDRDGGDRRGGRGGRGGRSGGRGGQRGGDSRAPAQNNQKSSFSMDAMKEAFPTLGGKK